MSGPRSVFAVDRGIWDDPDFPSEPFSEREAWIWLVGAAAWKDGKIRCAVGVVELKRGEFSFAIRFLAERWSWSKSRVDRFLNRLENRDMIRDTSRDGSKIYFLKNYNAFQIVGVPKRDENGTAAGHERDTSGTKKKQDKQDKHDLFAASGGEATGNGSGKNRTQLPQEFPHQAAKDAAVKFWTERNRPDLAKTVEEQAAQFRDHHTSRGNRMMDWPAAWRTWIRNALEFNRAPNGGNGRHTPEPEMAADTDTWVWRLTAFFLGDDEAGVPKGYWQPKWGPKPGVSGCVAPQAAMQAFRARHPGEPAVRNG